MTKTITLILLLAGLFIPVGAYSQTVRVEVDVQHVVQRNFGGVGFHAFHHVHPINKAVWNEVVYKRWRELRPSFVRLNHSNRWTKDQLDTVALHLAEYKRTGTEVYFATWDPQDCNDDSTRAAYAKKVVDNLEYFARTCQFDNIRYYCMSNELSLRGWAALRNDLPKFKAYHQAIYNELTKRKLGIKLLATDASPVNYWNTIEWAMNNMDDITGAYGGHHYFNNHTPSDTSCFRWFYDKTSEMTRLSNLKGKPFIIGEFGAKQDGRVINGIKNDACIYWDTPDEPMVGIQVPEVMMAAMNAGVYAMGYWTFMDFPDPKPGDTYQNKWGIFKWSKNDFSTRAPYYSIGLMTKYFGSGAIIYKVKSNDPLVRVTAVKHPLRNTWSVAVINRHSNPVDISINIPGENITLRKYVYNPYKVPFNQFGDLQPPTGKVSCSKGIVSDKLESMSLSVYTSNFDSQAPSKVEGIMTQVLATGGISIQWKANREDDLCYYRVYRSGKRNFKPSVTNQVASTIAANFTDMKAGNGRRYYYKVIAVDNSGNPY